MGYEKLIAHTPNRATGKVHLLEAHLRSVAGRAAQLGAKFGSPDTCRLLGLCHDLGKANPDFQRYLMQCAKGGRPQSVPHSAPGAVAASKLLGAFALAVLGHHEGLCDGSAEAKQKLHRAQTEMAEGVNAARSLLSELGGTNLGKAQPPAWARDELTCEMLLRFCFSALVDADYLDTEAHFDPARHGSWSHLCECVGSLERQAELCSAGIPGGAVRE